MDYYHLTGDIEAYDAAIGIGKNVKCLLETPVFQKSGQVSARETGWALRTLVALYVETNEVHWLEKCDWIVVHFKEWKEEYGLWLSSYMDNVAIRVVFMITVAVCSLMRYYRINRDDAIKEMITIPLSWKPLLLPLSLPGIKNILRQVSPPLIM